VLAQLVGVVLGVTFAVLRLSKNPVTSFTSSFYIWFFRGTPVLVQLLFWFNGVPGVFKTLTIAVPFTHVVLYSTPMVVFMTPFMAALLGLGLNEGAYMAEIVRAGILSVDEGQTEAAHALGMSLASVVHYGELLRRAGDIYSRNLAVIELLVVASIYYLALTSVASVGQYYLERRFARGSSRQLPATPFQRLRRSLGWTHA
jgi:polar amino acid transport system permease protein